MYIQYIGIMFIVYELYIYIYIYIYIVHVLLNKIYFKCICFIQYVFSVFPFSLAVKNVFTIQNNFIKFNLHISVKNDIQ